MYSPAVNGHCCYRRSRFGATSAHMTCEAAESEELESLNVDSLFERRARILPISWPLLSRTSRHQRGGVWGGAGSSFALRGAKAGSVIVGPRHPRLGG